MAKQEQAAHHEKLGIRLIVTDDPDDPERPIEFKRVQLDPAERNRLLRLREEEQRKR